MTQLAEHPSTTTESLQAAELLIEEVRQRMKRRRRRVGAVAGLLLVGAISSFVATRGPNGPQLPPSLSAQSFAKTVVPATLAAKSATFSMAEEVRKTPYLSCSRIYDSGITSGTGAINFATSTVSYVSENRGCFTHKLSFCATPIPTIETSNELYQYIPRRGSSCSSSLTRSGKRKIVVTPGPVSSKPWDESPLTLEGGDASSDPGIRGPLVSWRPLSIINALQGRMTRVRVSTINGESATEYRGAATLASVHAVTDFDPTLTKSQGTLQPPAKQIPIKINVWVDNQNRVVQISTIEPLFTGVQKGGADEEGFTQIFSTEFANGGRLVQQGYAFGTVDFSSFGRAVNIAVPPASKIIPPAER